MKQFYLISLSVLVLALTLSACSNPTPIPSAAPTAALEPTISPTLVPSPTPLPTPPPPPTVLLEPKLYVINIKQNIPPADLLEQLVLYGPGAGGGNFGDTPPTTGAWISAYSGASIPAMPRTLYWEASNFAANPEPVALLTLPDGSALPLEVSFWNDWASTEYQVLPGALLGTYTLKIQQGNIVLQDSVTLEMPTKKMYTHYQDNLWFAGFQPNEQVVLTLYYSRSFESGTQPEIPTFLPEISRTTAMINRSGSSDPFNMGGSCKIIAFLKEQIITADAYGGFQVNVTIDQKNVPFIAVARGESSGLVTNFDTFWWSGCADAQPTRLEMGDTARVTDNAAPLSPDFTNIQLSSGDTVKMVLGPICYSRSTWIWWVETPEGVGMWVPEGDANGYYLELVNP